MKYYAFTSNPEGFLSGYSNTFIIRAEKDNACDGWVFLGEVEFDRDAIDMKIVRAGAVREIDNEIEKKTQDFTAGMECLKQRKESLLAIEHKPDDNS